MYMKKRNVKRCDARLRVACKKKDACMSCEQVPNRMLKRSKKHVRRPLGDIM